MYPIVVRPSCILSMQSRATLPPLPLSSSSVFAASFFFCFFLLLFGFASSSPCLWAGEWERMPNSSMPHLGRHIAMGLNHTVILHDAPGVVGELNPPPAGNVMAVGNNSLNQLGYTTSGTAINPCINPTAWVGNPLLDYVNHQTMTPFPMPGDPLVRCRRMDSVIALAAGWNFSLALRADGLLTSWGDNSQGQLGRGLIDNSPSPCPRRVITRDPRMVPQGYTEAALSNVIAMDGGKSHAIALRADGSVWAWGSNALGQLGICDNSVASSFYALPVKRVNDIPGQPAVELDNIIAIACGDDFSLALAADGKVWAWGHNNKGQIGNNSFGSDVFCAVQVVGIGGSGFLANVTCIDGGGEHAVAVLANGNVVGWGDNQYGQLALDDQNSPLSYSTYPRLMRSASTTFGNAPAQKYAVAAVASKYITLVLLANGNIRTAGRNERGALCIGSDNFTQLRRHLGTVTDSLASGNVSTINCGVNSYSVSVRGELWSWGDNCQRQQAAPLFGADNGYFTIGVRNLRIGIAQAPITIGTDPIALSSGAAHTFVLRPAGWLNGWGWNYRMQLGTGTGFPPCNLDFATLPNESLLPLSYHKSLGDSGGVIDWKESRAIMCAMKHTATIKFNGEVASWGFDWHDATNTGNNLCTGQEENCPATNSRLLWKRAAEIWHPHVTVQATESGGDEGNNVFALAIASAKGCADVPTGQVGGYKLGYYPTYAVTATGRVVGWGTSNPDPNNGYNELTEANSSSSYAVYIHTSPNDLLENIVAVAAGPHFGVALDATGHLWKWGTICEYAGGPPNTKHRFAYATMVPNEEINNVKAIAATGANEEHNFILALRADGNVWAMGYNILGQCGLSNSGLQPPVVTYQATFTPIRDCSPALPVQYSKLRNAVKSIEVNPKNGVALRADGTLWIWGSNQYKQFGNCSNSLTEYLPQQANTNPCTEEYRAPLLNINLISSSCDCVFGLDASGTLYSAGVNDVSNDGHIIKYIRGVASDSLRQDYFAPAPSRDQLRMRARHNVEGAEAMQSNSGGNKLTPARTILRKGLRVYPNPASSSAPLWVGSSENGKVEEISIKLYSLQGEEVCSLKATTGLAKFDLNTQLPDVAAGSYLLVAIYTDGSREEQMIIVQ